MTRDGGGAKVSFSVWVCMFSVYTPLPVCNIYVLITAQISHLFSSLSIRFFLALRLLRLSSSESVSDSE